MASLASSVVKKISASILSPLRSENNPHRIKRQGGPHLKNKPVRQGRNNYMNIESPPSEHVKQIHHRYHWLMFLFN